jgi:hypothetical protein
MYIPANKDGYGVYPGDSPLGRYSITSTGNVSGKKWDIIRPLSLETIYKIIIWFRVISYNISYSKMGFTPI